MTTPSTSSSTTLSPQQQHYQMVEQYTKEREFKWDQLALNLKIGSKQFEQIQKIGKALEKRLKFFIQAEVVSVMNGEILTKQVIKEMHEDIRVRPWIALALEMIQRQKHLKLAGLILNHLHDLGVENYCLQSGKRKEEKHQFRSAERYYHAVSLMHPFDLDYHLVRAVLWSAIGDNKKSLQIYKDTRKLTEDPTDLKAIDFGIVFDRFILNKPIHLSASGAQKYLDRLLEILQLVKQTKQLNLSLLYWTSDWLGDYCKQIGYYDTFSYQKLLEFMQKMVLLTEEFEGSEELRKKWSEQFIHLVSLIDLSSEDAIAQAKSKMISLAKYFHTYPNVVSCYEAWCMNNGFPEDIIDFHRDLKDLPLTAHYFLAKAALSYRNKNLQKMEFFLKKSYELDPSGWTTFNLGSFYLLTQGTYNPKLAKQYFEELMHLDFPGRKHYLGYWASSLLSDDKKSATESLEKALENLQISEDLQVINACYAFQKNEEYTKEEVLSCAGFVKTFAPDFPAIKKIIIIPKDIQDWIEIRKIDLCDGYIGIPLHQINTSRMHRDHQGHYREELIKKLQTETSLDLPRDKHDCWIGRNGKNPIPRIDLEAYHQKGSSPHFQRLRFQQLEVTYGGLWLPVSVPATTDKVILTAYQAWLEADSSYLAVFNPKHYGDDLVTLYSEIKGMDHSDKISI